METPRNDNPPPTAACGIEASACAAASLAGCACNPASLANLRAAANRPDNDPARPAIRVRPAVRGDAVLLWQMVCELAAYESLSHEIESTPQAFAAHFFGEKPLAFAHLALYHGIPAGFAVWYPTYSTFAGRAGAFLEDLYTRPALRRKGVGMALLNAAADAAAAQGCSRLEWRALKWNKPALDFYQSIGAAPLSEWVVLRRDILPTATSVTDTAVADTAVADNAAAAPAPTAAATHPPPAQ
ncbi:MAG: GNAT family N-acetyltransferase [Puniceicoccales bacterium]|jgi:GNAT superfamily N-acetyltransferase|nr:GNAT family N-acetyltransferase [Puniceicoccales bacterium]